MKLEILSLSLFLLASCASQKVSDRSFIRSDSLRQTAHLSIRQMAVPASCADLQIPVAGLRELPPTAVYTTRSGQATATVRFLHDTLFVSASCDSLQQLIYDYQQQIEQLSASSRHTTETKKKNNCRISFGLIALLVAVCLLGFRAKRR